mmetsp:Transcript_4394/g.11011  ORF Transcript_4394/g.11011 Transcript_4394/m.11011 type:complete len:254 (-) Transcript_4394:356-1117(-)
MCRWHGSCRPISLCCLGLLGDLVFLVELLLDGLPGNAEHHGLQDVGEQAGLQATAKQRADAALLHDALDGAGIAEVGVGAGLLDGLNDAQAIGYAVGDRGSADTDTSVANQLHLALLLRHCQLQRVEGREPGVVAHPVGREVGAGATVKCADALLGHPLVELLERLGALNLQGGLVAVDGHDENAPCGATDRGEGSLNAHGHAGVIGVSHRQDTGVGGGVAEAADRGLYDGVRQTAVETADAAGDRRRALLAG